VVEWTAGPAVVVRRRIDPSCTICRKIRRRDHGFKRDRSTIEGTEEHAASKRPRAEREAEEAAAALAAAAADESDDDDDDEEDDEEG